MGETKSAHNEYFLLVQLCNDSRNKEIVLSHIATGCKKCSGLKVRNVTKVHGFEGFDRPIHFVKTVSALMLMKRRFIF